MYRNTGGTPPWAYQSLIRLFCLTGGWSNDLVAWAITRTNSRVALSNVRGVLGDLSASEVQRIAERIRADGYHVFERCLSAELCERLVQFATRTPSRVRAMDGAAKNRDLVLAYDRHSPTGIRYDLASEDVINNPDVQALMADASILTVAQTYLGTRPLADVIGMWWHTAYSTEPDEEAAQFYHFDMDRIRWLKFFIYLTDVGPDNGPHCFVRGSHRSGGIPWRLRAKGYARLSDAEVRANYPAESIVEFCAPQGTVIAEDTRGLHKGLHVRAGDRLMLQIQFSNSLFGGSYPTAHLRPPLHSDLARRVKEAPAVYQAYLGTAGGR
jgi:hypothetical protein